MVTAILAMMDASYYEGLLSGWLYVLPVLLDLAMIERLGK